jgi:hypothetical protein
MNTTNICAVGAPVTRERQDGERLIVTTFIPFKIRRRGNQHVVVRPLGADAAQSLDVSPHDRPLIAALTRAFYWQQLLDDGLVESGSDIARQEGLHPSTVNELLRLTLLAPVIIQSIVDGTQPNCMTLMWFQRNPLPTDWEAQAKVIEEFDR